MNAFDAPSPLIVPDENDTNELAVVFVTFEAATTQNAVWFSTDTWEVVLYKYEDPLKERPEFPFNAFACRTGVPVAVNVWLDTLLSRSPVTFDPELNVKVEASAASTHNEQSEIPRGLNGRGDDAGNAK